MYIFDVNNLHTCLKGAHMWDKADMEIPFSAAHVSFLTSFSQNDHQSAFVDFKDYDFPVSEDFVYINGQREVISLSARKWGKISSGLSGIAIGFFPSGNGFNPWPHIRIKASPAKILQGHNVFGSESITEGILQMFANLKMAFPKIYDHLDLSKAEMRYLDSTYSASISDFYWTKVVRMFEALATGRTKVNSNYIDRGYVQLGKDSKYQRQKLYSKIEEIISEALEAKKSRDMTRYKILTNPHLLDFARDKRRFEATTGYAKLISLGIPTNVNEFIKYCDWFLSVHKIPLCRWLWSLAFEPLFKQFEGHTMKNVDDTHIKLKIDAKFIKIKDNGKLCQRKAKAIYRTYRDIKNEGYSTLCSQDCSTFYRNVQHLEQAGISKAFLKSLDPKKPHDNIVPLVHLIKIDFSNQRPDWYEEPTAGYDKPERHLKLVNY